jgi:hypothetical protein
VLEKLDQQLLALAAQQQRLEGSVAQQLADLAASTEAQAARAALDTIAVELATGVSDMPVAHKSYLCTCLIARCEKLWPTMPCIRYMYVLSVLQLTHGLGHHPCRAPLATAALTCRRMGVCVGQLRRAQLPRPGRQPVGLQGGHIRRPRPHQQVAGR